MSSDAEKLMNEAQRIHQAISPVLAGLIIDAVDLATFGPVGLIVGLPVGGLAGYWLGQSMGMSKQHCLYCALAAGIYCTMPLTSILPLGTIVGACVRYQQGEKSA